MKTKFSSYFLIGSIFALFGGFVANIINIIYIINIIKGDNLFLEYLSLIAPMLGMIVESYYFSSGLAYKSYVLEQDAHSNKTKLIDQLQVNERILLEKNEIQSNISKDLHDDIGSDLSSINFNSHTLVQNLDNKVLSIALSETINEKSKEISQKLKTFIWALDEEKDFLVNFAEYVKDYYYKTFENTLYKIEFFENINSSEAKIDGFVRKNLFLIIKESLNNIIKHAKASHICLEITLENSKKLNIKIKDNGIGLQKENINGNGIINMKNRMNKLNGTFEIFEENGTLILISLEI